MQQRVLNAAALRDLRGCDNVSNWPRILLVWGIIIGSVALTIWAATFNDGLVTAVAVALDIVVIGASQHQLGGAIHEGCHHILFDNRTLNEAASDFMCAFPIVTTTYHYRVHHLAHHQFVNDPVLDPDHAQMKESGHWLDFPISHVDFVLAVARQLWLPNLIRYTATRARYSATGGAHSPYKDATRQGSRWVMPIGIAYTVGLPIVLTVLLAYGHGWAALGVLAAAYLALTAYHLSLPERAFPGSRLEPVISHKATSLGRTAHLTLIYAALTAVQAAGWGPAWAWFGLLWVVPLFTTFPLFMILRQWVQHGNADRGRYTNSRVFLSGPLVRYAVFPWGQDYHLPHHMFASVPHYKLKALHALLLTDPEYRDNATIVEGYFGPDDPRTGRPTAVSVLGPHHAPHASDPSNSPVGSSRS